MRNETVGTACPLACASALHVLLRFVDFTPRDIPHADISMIYYTLHPETPTGFVGHHVCFYLFCMLGVVIITMIAKQTQEIKPMSRDDIIQRLMSDIQEHKRVAKGLKEELAET